MKRLLALLLALCVCVAVLSSCASCDSGGDGEVETPSAPTEPKKYADPKLIKKLQTAACSNRKEVKELFGVEPINYDDKYDKADVYMFDDGRAVYIEYYHNESQGIMNTKVEEMIDPALLDQIKRGYSYDKITEIFGGVKGDMTTSIYWGLYRYVLNDGRLLYINYDERKFATSIYTKDGGGETIDLYPNTIKAFTCDNMEEFKQQLVKNYSGEETKFAVPRIVSSKYEVNYISGDGSCVRFLIAPIGVEEHSKEFLNESFYITIYTIDIMYSDMVELYRTEYKNNVVEYGDNAAHIGKYFILNDNGRAIIVEIPDVLVDGNFMQDENRPPITTLEQLEEYVVIEYFDLSDSSSGEE